MVLRFNVLGFTLASIDLDLDDLVGTPPSSASGLTLNDKKTTVLDRGIKAMSGFWVGRMLKG